MGGRGVPFGENLTFKIAHRNSRIFHAPSGPVVSNRAAVEPCQVSAEAYPKLWKRRGSGMWRRVVAPVAVIALVGCGGGVGANQSTYGLVLADESMVTRCEFLGDVSGVSSWYGLFAEEGLTSARDEALKEAVKVKATHVLWTQQNVTYGSTAVHGRSYRC